MKIRCLIRSENNPANIYVLLSAGRKKEFVRKTGKTIDPKKWDAEKSSPKGKTDDIKNLREDLKEIDTFITRAFNNDEPAGIEINGDWLQKQIDLFNGKTVKVDLDILTTYIQKYIDEAPFKQNAKKELGLSRGRVQNLKLFKNTILKYESEVFKGKSILIKDINLQFLEKFKIWMFGKGYSTNYVGKNIANFRTVCRDAGKNDIVISTQVKNFKGISESREPEDIITLDEQEQEQIKKAVLLREALINARKWLLLGCLIGQRAGDLLNITDKNIKEIAGVKIIELKQQKTGKLVAIPLLPEAVEIIENGLPYKISLSRFNEYIKDVCQIAGLDAPTKARIKEKKGQPHKKDIFPKWEVISSHVCRRSFATNFYGRIPTPILMNITAHGTERMFLLYIGKTTYDNAFQMIEYFNKLAPRTKEAPAMEVIRNTAEK
ncbi:phage integrase SAM-like domain-containing protein [Flavobacterium sp. WC2429]|uniref:Phage integrase SAM-like domain-containing protein n=1 Tax=Flavobacterium sp. WC2429 TaxID=3234140 RepID=A0AB39WKT1_9FLAO